MCFVCARKNAVRFETQTRRGRGMGNERNEFVGGVAACCRTDSISDGDGDLRDRDLDYRKSNWRYFLSIQTFL